MNFLQPLKTLTLAVILSIGIGYAYAAWAPPTAAPTGGNAEAPVNVGGAGQVKSGALTVGQLLTAYGTLRVGSYTTEAPPVDGMIVKGNVGIGVTNPATKLDVNGAIKVGDFATCGATEAGAIRYNSGTFQGCNGTTWIALSGGVSYTPGFQTWTTVGPIPPFTVPVGVTSLKVTMAGGGGGGEGGNNNGGGSGGGGGGGYSEYIIAGLTPGQVINGYVGAGGTPGGYSVGSPWAQNGGSTTFGSLVATGGRAGQRDAGENIIDNGGLGGSPGGQQGGPEGGNGYGGASGAGQGALANAGSPGNLYGGGGGGGNSSSSVPAKAGAPGWIMVEW